MKIATYKHRAKSAVDCPAMRPISFRMDFLLLNDALKPRLGETGVDAEFNARDKPSDHAPVWMTLTD